MNRAGERLEVEYAGMGLGVLDMGTSRAAQIFVAASPSSQLSYAEANWYQSHKRTGSAPDTPAPGLHRRLREYAGPEDLKVGVIHASSL